jgi:hypothetical protein
MTAASPSGREVTSLICLHGWRLERFASEDGLAAMTDNCLASGQRPFHTMTSSEWQPSLFLSGDIGEKVFSGELRA